MSRGNDGHMGRGRRAVLKGVGAAATVGVTGLAGCVESLGGGGGSSTDSLTVGYVTSLSGPFAVFGKAALDGAKLAVSDLKDELDVDITVKTGDTNLEPSTGVSKMKQLVTEGNADFVMGGVSSSVALKMSGWASQNEVIYFPTGSHSNAFNGSDCKKYTFRPTCSNAMLAHTIGPQMAKRADSWYLLYSDYTWGQTAQQTVSKILTNNDKTIVGKTATPFPNDDYAAALNKAKAADADGIGLLVAGLDLRKATNQLVSKGMQKNHTLAMHQLEDAVYDSKQAAGVLDIAGQVWGTSVDTKASKNFAQRVADNSDIQPYVRHFLGYVSMDQAVRAAVRAESTAAEDMRTELEGHEVSSKANDIKGGKMYWRKGDHQLIQPTYSVKARPQAKMTNTPYKQWFDVIETFAGDKVARSVSNTGCSL